MTNWEQTKAEAKRLLELLKAALIKDVGERWGEGEGMPAYYLAALFLASNEIADSTRAEILKILPDKEGMTEFLGLEVVDESVGGTDRK